MKNLLIMLFGAAIGVGGTLLWLRKDIQKRMKELEEQKNKEKTEENTEKEAEEPFSVSDEEPKTETKASEVVAYNNVVKVYENAKPITKKEALDIRDETDGAIFEIDKEDFGSEDDIHEKEHLVYFRGDKVMATEAGTIIPNPFPLIGGEWENCVGNYADRTAFIRNLKQGTDYEIYVEDGTYEEEYGMMDGFDED